MQHQPFLRLLCLRHGKTNYTGQFPDLTPEGFAEVRRAAHASVLSWVQRNCITQERLRFISSPAPRARGTTHVIVNEIAHSNDIMIRDELNQMAWRDNERCKLALQGLHGRGYIDYETEPIFADKELFETPSEMRERFFSFLAKYVEESDECGETQYRVLVSHYEVFCHIVSELFGVAPSEATALRHVEPIELSFFEMEQGAYYVAGCFRDIDCVASFDIKTKTLTLV